MKIIQKKMANKVLLISEDYIKEQSIINDNMWGKYIFPAIIYAQENYLQSVLGSALYERILELVQLGSITATTNAHYKTLLDDKIHPFLLNRVIADIIPEATVKIANIGAVTTSDEKINNISQAEADLLRNKYIEQADFYLKLMQDWLKANASAFNELYMPSIVKPNLESANNSTGIWLGGFRSKVYKSKNPDNTGSVSGGTEYQAGFQDGFSSGKTYQKSLLSAITIDENGTYTNDSGYSSVTVYISAATPEGKVVIWESGYTSGWTDGHSSGVTDGIAEQKAKLSANTFTTNGTYTYPDGLSAITVNVSGGSGPAVLVELSVSANGVYTPAVGEDGFNKVTVNVDETTAYESGYTAGHSSGVTEQKSLLSAATFTSNGLYQRSDGYNFVNVNVPTITTVSCTKEEYAAMSAHSNTIIYLITNN